MIQRLRWLASRRHQHERMRIPDFTVSSFGGLNTYLHPTALFTVPDQDRGVAHCCAAGDPSSSRCRRFYLPSQRQSSEPGQRPSVCG
jgi:hypothetical protein